MSQTSSGPATGPSHDDPFTRLAEPLPAPSRKPSAAWQGWAYFGGAVMGAMGLLWALAGLIALVDDGYYTLRENSLLVASSYTAWGWVHLIGGIVAAVTGAAILWGGRPWARTLGVVVAVLSAVVNMGFVRATPVWALLVIALDVLVIYALTVHGWEIDEG